MVGIALSSQKVKHISPTSLDDPYNTNFVKRPIHQVLIIANIHFFGLRVI